MTEQSEKNKLNDIYINTSLFCDPYNATEKYKNRYND